MLSKFINRLIMKSSYGFCKTFKEIKWELLLSFIAMVLGILLGFYLSNLGQNYSNKQNTLSILRSLHSETEYNMENGKVIKRHLSDTINYKHIFPKTTTLVASSVIIDKNIFNVIEIPLYNKIRGYVQICENINYMLPIYNQHLQNNNYLHDSSLEEMKRKIVQQASQMMAYSMFIRIELKKILKFNIDFLEKKKEYNKSIDSLYNIVSEDGFKIIFL